MVSLMDSRPTPMDSTARPSLQLRPSFSRTDTSQILDYYVSAGTYEPQSSASVDVADTAIQSTSQPVRADTPPPLTDSPPPSVFRRTRLPSVGAADNRRLHIVELDDGMAGMNDPATRATSASPSRDENKRSPSKSSSSNLLTRRGLGDHGRLALVAPPDADATSYTNLSPPVDGTSIVPKSAPVNRRYQHAKYMVADSENDGDESEIAAHRRTRSQGSHLREKAANRGFGGKRSPRDGMLFFPPGDYSVATPPMRKKSTSQDQTKPPSTSAPLDNTAMPGSSPPQASTSSHISLTSQHLLPNTTFDKVVTPAIGEEKDPMTRVAGPVVVGVGSAVAPSLSVGTSAPSSRPTSGSSFGVVSVGSPPPRPPRAMGARPRPAALGTSSAPSPPQTIASKLASGDSRPHLTTMDSDFSFSAMTVSSAGSSGSVPQLTASRSNGSAISEQDQEQDLPGVPRHRREAAKGNGPDDSPVAPTIAVVTDDSSSPPPEKLAAVALSNQGELFPARPPLISKWSSWTDQPLSNGTSPLPAAKNMDDLLDAVGHEIDDIGLVKSGDVPPPNVVEPVRDTEKDPAHRRVAMSRLDEEDEPSPPKASLELLPPSSSTPSRPSSAGSSDVASRSIDLSSPQKSLPLPTGSMVGVGAGMGRTSSRASPFENVMEESASEFEFDSRKPPRTNGMARSTPLGQTPSRRMSTSSVPRTPRSPSITSSTFSFRRHAEQENDMTPITARRKHRRPGQLPDAMYCKDVMKKKTPLERATGYAQKLRELLAEEDSGLGDWVIYCKAVASGGPSKRSREPSPALGIGRAGGHPPRNRDVSHGSEASDITFPVRADAYAATQVNIHDSPPRGPPANLPYPGAIGLRPSPSVRSGVTVMTTTSGAPTNISVSAPNSMRSLKSPTGTASSNGSGGFFATIGRKASMRKDGRPALSQLNKPNGAGSGIGFNSLTSRPSQVPLPPSSKGIMMSTPTVVGGPRPPPPKSGGVARANSLLASLGRRSTERDEVNVDKAISEAGHGTRSDSPEALPQTTLVPRSSLTYKRASASIDASAAFNANLDKLADVLPHVERTVLALYLRRAGGEDLKAIGAYLEDEKNGVVMGR